MTETDGPGTALVTSNTRSAGEMHDIGIMDPVQPGQYWTYEGGENRSGLVTGRAYLVTDVKLLDGEAHTVIIRRHPLETREQYPTTAREMLASAFYGQFSRVADAEAVRRREMEEIMGRVDAIQEELRAGPPSMPGDGAALLQIARHVETAEQDLGTMISNIDKVDAMRQAAARQVVLAEASAAWMTERTKEMGATLTVLGDYHQEAAAAQVAAVSKVVKHAKRLEEGVKTLNLYTGEGVEARLLVDGDPAGPDAGPLHLYQRLLFMDEEYLVHVNDAGADYHDFGDFAADLARDPALVRRLLPMPRSIVAMRPRRKDKIYFEGDSPSDTFMNMLYNQPNRQAFLLIRDGDRIWHVESELGTYNVPRLFPTKDEADKPFRGWGGERVGIDNVRYTDQLAESDKIALQYKRLLILLWGLHDRLEVFGNIAAPGTNFLSMDFQSKAFKFVHDDEEGLPHNMKPFNEWIAEKNALLQSGSRVLCLWKNLANPATAPGLVRNDGSRRYSDLRWLGRPATTSDVVIARKSGSSIVVDMEATRAGWDNHGKPYKVVVDLTKWEESDSHYWRSEDDYERAAFLVLDGVRPEEIDFYLNSRSQRAGYLSYVPLFFAVRDALIEERRQAEPFMTKLRDDLRAAGALTPENEDDVGSAVEESIRLWRAANRGKPIPEPGSEQWPAAMKAIYDVVWRLTQDQQAIIDRVQTDFWQAGIEPLRVVSTGRGKLAVYGQSDQIRKPVPLTQWPWVSRWQVPAKGSVAETEPRWAILTARGDEKVLHDWPDAASWTDRKLPYDRAEPGHFEALADQFRSTAVRHWWLDMMCGRPVDPEKLIEEAEIVAYWMSENGAAKAIMSLPIGLLEVYRPDAVFKAYNEKGPRLHPEEVRALKLVLLRADARPLLVEAAPDDLRPGIAEILSSVFAAPALMERNLLSRRADDKAFYQPSLAIAGMKSWVEAGMPSGLTEQVLRRSCRIVPGIDLDVVLPKLCKRDSTPIEPLDRDQFRIVAATRHAAASCDVARAMGAYGGA